MGIFNSIGKEIQREFIARPDEAKDFIIYKHPDANIRKFSQLTVEADEVCIFFRDGKVAGVIKPGRVTLDASNIPFLGMLIDAASGGNLFVTEVYFVSTREFVNLPFGGLVGDVTDPETNLAIGLRVFGEYSLKVTNPERLIIGLVGMQKLESNEKVSDWFKQLLVKTVRDILGEQVLMRKMPVLDLTSAAYTEELEELIVKRAAVHVDNYGVNIVRLGNCTVTMKEEDEETLKRYRKDTVYTKLAGGFQQYAAGEAMLGAGEGMRKEGGGTGEGSAVLGGAGLGVGLGIATAFMNMQKGKAEEAASASTLSDGSVACMKCEKIVPAGKFCKECGSSLSLDKLCPVCKSKTASDAKFCTECGKPLKNG